MNSLPDSRRSRIINARPPGRGRLDLRSSDALLVREAQAARYIDSDYYYKRSYKGYVSA